MTKARTAEASTEALRARVQEAQAVKVDPQRTVRAWLQQVEPELRRAVPRGVDAARIVRLALTEIRRNPQLALCTRDSLLGAVMWSAQLGLEIGAPLGQSFIVPYRNHGTLEAQWVLGYTGALALIYRSPRVRDIYVGTVREGDLFTYRRGIEDVLVHEPAGFDETRPVTAYYLMVRFQDGGHYIAVMTPAEIERRRKKALRGAPRSGAWLEWPEEMERKTLVRAHYRYLPMDVQTQRAFAADEAILRPAAPDAEDDGIVTVTPAVEVLDETAAPHEVAPAVQAPENPPATKAQSPHEALKVQFGRLGLGGRAIAACLEPFGVIEVSALKTEQAQELSSLLSGVAEGAGQAEVVALVRSHAGGA